jgi:hypothetical protein
MSEAWPKCVIVGAMALLSWAASMSIFAFRFYASAVGSVGVQCSGQGMVSNAIGSTRHNADATHDLLRRASGPRETFQSFPCSFRVSRRDRAASHTLLYGESR